MNGSMGWRSENPLSDFDREFEALSRQFDGGKKKVKTTVITRECPHDEWEICDSDSDEEVVDEC
jgi:hypothetical protein